jgi:hypothetical protein
VCLCVDPFIRVSTPKSYAPTLCHPANSAPPLSIAFLTAFDHVDTRFTSLSCHSYVILGVRLVHCLRSSGNCRALSAGVSARSLRGSPRCALTLTMNVRAPRSTLSLTHSMIFFMMLAFASPASVVRGPLHTHLDSLSKVTSTADRSLVVWPAVSECPVSAVSTPAHVSPGKS